MPGDKTRIHKTTPPSRGVMILPGTSRAHGHNRDIYAGAGRQPRRLACTPSWQLKDPASPLSGIVRRGRRVLVWLPNGAPKLFSRFVCLFSRVVCLSPTTNARTHARTYQPNDGVAPFLAGPQGALLLLAEVRHPRLEPGGVAPPRMHGVEGDVGSVLALVQGRPPLRKRDLRPLRQGVAAVRRSGGAGRV